MYNEFENSPAYAKIQGPYHFFLIKNWNVYLGRENNIIDYNPGEEVHAISKSNKISRKHVHIFWDEKKGEWFVKNLSKNHIYINKNIVKNSSDPVRISPVSSIQIDDEKFYFFQAREQGEEGEEEKNKKTNSEEINDKMNCDDISDNISSKQEITINNQNKTSQDSNLEIVEEVHQINQIPEIINHSGIEEQKSLEEDVQIVLNDYSNDVKMEENIQISPHVTPLLNLVEENINQITENIDNIPQIDKCYILEEKNIKLNLENNNFNISNQVKIDIDNKDDNTIVEE